MTSSVVMAKRLIIPLTILVLFGAFLFLTYYMQQTLGFSPVENGLAFLPMVVAIVISANISTRPSMSWAITGTRPWSFHWMLSRSIIGPSRLAGADTS